MAGPSTPSAEGPTFAPPSLPAGWIAQWDSSSKKYYYVQLSTGVSQWEIPTHAVQTGNTPAQPSDHPYGTPGGPPHEDAEVITHPDGSQTVRHADGTMEPILPDGMRGVDGPNGDRGLGTMAMNALLGGKQGHGSSGGKNSAGKLVGQLASTILSPSNKPEPPQNYHGGHTSGQPSHHQGGLAGAVMGGVVNMFAGNDKPGHGGSGHDFGYTNSGSNGGYSGQAPTYNPPGSSGGPTTPSGATHSYHSSQPSHHQTPQTYPPPHPNDAPQQHGHYPAPQGPPPSQGSSYGHYSHSPQQPPPPASHGGGYPQHPPYGAPPPGSHNAQYPPPPGPPAGGYGASYAGGYPPQAPYGAQAPYGQQPSHGYGGPY